MPDSSRLFGYSVRQIGHSSSSDAEVGSTCGNFGTYTTVGMISSASVPHNASFFAYKIMGLAQRFRFSVWLMLIFFPVNMVLNFKEGGEPITLAAFFWSFAGYGWANTYSP
jgi:hypothetical protein